MLEKLNLVNLVVHVALLSRCFHDTPMRVIFRSDYSSFLIKLRFLHLRKKGSATTFCSDICDYNDDTTQANGA